MKNTSPAFKPIEWPVKNVRAFSTSILHPDLISLDSDYGSFNLGDHVGDDPAIVQSNRKKLLDYFPTAASIQWLEQVHGSDVVSIDKNESHIVADALVTRKKNVALAIMTADCLPIVLSNIDGSVIGAIHGGWKPLSKGIIKKAITAMSLNSEDIYVWLGPCIGNHKFEVGSDVYDVFDHLHLNYESAFEPIYPVGADGVTKYLANLHTIAKIQLSSLGIANIYTLPDCTYSMSDTYYSYRRQKNTGRMATLICSV